MRKTPWIALLLPCALFLGFIGGMLFGSLFVARDAGLAAGASILFYGLVGLIVAAVLTIVLARRLPPSALKAAALAALALSIIGAVLVAWRFVEAQREMRARSRIARISAVIRHPHSVVDRRWPLVLRPQSSHDVRSRQ